MLWPVPRQRVQGTICGGSGSAERMRIVPRPRQVGHWEDMGLLGCLDADRAACSCARRAVKFSQCPSCWQIGVSVVGLPPHRQAHADGRTNLAPLPLAGLFLWPPAAQPTARRPVDAAGLLVSFEERATASVKDSEAIQRYSLPRNSACTGRAHDLR